MRFSSLADSLTAQKNPLYILHDELRASGQPILDLVKGNVNEHGIVYPQDVLTQILQEATISARKGLAGRSRRDDQLAHGFVLE